jgi:hypothetical protein
MAFCADKETGIIYRISDGLSETGWLQNLKGEK